MDIVSQLYADLDDVQAHLDDMFACSAVVTAAHIALEGTLHSGQERLVQVTGKQERLIRVRTNGLR